VPAQPASARPKFKLLHSFGGPGDGNNPDGSPMLDAKGDLYGVTSGGPGEYGNGTVYELTPQANGTWKETILHSFQDGNDGAIPQGALVLDSVHDLYGTLVGDVGDSYGIFELSRGSGGWTNTHIYTDAAGPGLLIDSLGNLYGNMTPSQYGYAAIGELSPGTDGWNYTALYSFCSHQPCEDGWGPPAPPIWGGKGNMYGTTDYGGNGKPYCQRSGDGGCGVLFKMMPNGDGTWTYRVLHRFASSSTDGQVPGGGFVMDAAGNLYGNTEGGGVHDNGTIFKFSFSKGRWRQTVLYDFPNCRDGCIPYDAMAIDGAGNLYGGANGGLPDCDGYECGVVFKVSQQKNGKWKYSVLHKLTAADGEYPLGVIIDAKGNLYGTTFMFGKYNAGTAFEIIP
jgi:uncharacterized repeat protein (TIGR03803 family)